MVQSDESVGYSVILEDVSTRIVQGGDLTFEEAKAEVLDYFNGFGSVMETQCPILEEVSSYEEYDKRLRAEGY